MGTDIRILIVSMWFVLFSAGMVSAGESACLKCHPVHFEENDSCTDCHLGRSDTYRKDIAHHRMIAARFAAFTLEGSQIVEKGRMLMENTACRRCHISAAKGNRFAANLDWSPRNATPEELYTSIKEPAIFMPDFYFSDKQLIELVNAIQAEARKTPQPVEEVPAMVHFEDSHTVDESVFQKKCGACHRILTKHKGGMGTGIIGPDLSGLLTEFYPKTYPEAKAWTAKGVEDWLKNPRKLLKYARMSPVSLKAEEWLKLQKDISGNELSEGELVSPHIP